MPRDRSPTRSQSRSPTPDRKQSDRSGYRHRSQSPVQQHQQHKHRAHRSHEHGRERHAEKRSLKAHKAEKPPVVLPLSSVPLSRHQLQQYRPLFASYLDIQKQLDIDELSEHEIKGRWKAFLGKWNRGELAEGWYDAATLAKATAAAAELERESASQYSHRPPVQNGSSYNKSGDGDDDDEDDDDDFGPTLPAQSEYLPSGSKARAGPTIPKTSDLAWRDEVDAEERADARGRQDLAWRAERTLQREREEELNPRAQAGTRERQLEKKRQLADSHRAFAESRGKGEGGGLAEVGEGELMGAEGGSEEVKKMKQHAERKKNERELRREEMLRARAAEREERLAGLKDREEQTMSMLKAIAKERFG